MNSALVLPETMFRKRYFCAAFFLPKFPIYDFDNISAPLNTPHRYTVQGTIRRGGQVATMMPVASQPGQ